MTADQPSQPPDEAALTRALHRHRPWPQAPGGPGECSRCRLVWPCDYERERLAHESTRRERDEWERVSRQWAHDATIQATHAREAEARLQAAEQERDQWRARAELLAALLEDAEAYVWTVAERGGQPAGTLLESIRAALATQGQPAGRGEAYRLSV